MGQRLAGEGWAARDVVGHLIDWSQSFIAGQTDLGLPAGPSVANDPAGARRVHNDAVQAVLDDPHIASRSHELDHSARWPWPTP